MEMIAIQAATISAGVLKTVLLLSKRDRYKWVCFVLCKRIVLFVVLEAIVRMLPYVHFPLYIDLCLTIHLIQPDF